jgi:hypothetical protein
VTLFQRYNNEHKPERSMRLQLCVALTLLGCTDALRSMTAHRPVAAAPMTWTTTALRRTSVPSTALRSSNDDGDRRLDIPDQPEYDVEGFDLGGILKGDPVTLTLVGFGLIAFNFFVLAGFGSGGL